MNFKLMTTLAVAAVMAATPVLAEEGKTKERRAGGMMMERLADEEGNITREDFLAKHAAHFDRLDTNGDGVLSAEERAAAHEAMKERRSEWKKKRGSIDPDSDPISE